MCIHADGYFAFRPKCEPSPQYRIKQTGLLSPFVIEPRLPAPYEYPGFVYGLSIVSLFFTIVGCCGCCCILFAVISLVISSNVYQKLFRYLSTPQYFVSI